MALIIKHQTVMPDREETEDGIVSFLPAVDEEGAPSSSLSISRELWEDMGSPETVTVTVEPGDLLNG